MPQGFIVHPYLLSALQEVHQQLPLPAGHQWQGDPHPGPAESSHKVRTTLGPFYLPPFYLINREIFFCSRGKEEIH